MNIYCELFFRGSLREALSSTMSYAESCCKISLCGVLYRVFMHNRLCTDYTLHMSLRAFSLAPSARTGVAKQSPLIDEPYPCNGRLLRRQVETPSVSTRSFS